MADRYVVSPKSESAHCCFEATVVDTARPQYQDNAKTVPFKDPEGKLYYESICECFSVEDAESIAAALNAANNRTKEE